MNFLAIESELIIEIKKNLIGNCWEKEEKKRMRLRDFNKAQDEPN